MSYKLFLSAFVYFAILTLTGCFTLEVRNTCGDCSSDEKSQYDPDPDPDPITVVIRPGGSEPIGPINVRCSKGRASTGPYDLICDGQPWSVTRYVGRVKKTVECKCEGE